MPLRPIKVVAPFAGVVGLAAALHADATWQARASLRDVLAQHPGWSVAALDVAPFGGRVTLRGIKGDAGPLHIAIGALDLPSPPFAFGLTSTAYAQAQLPPPHPATDAAPAPGGAKPGTASADNVVIVSRGTTFRIGHIEMTGSLLSSADLATLLDAKNPESLSARVAKISASAITIPEITADTVTPGIEQHWTQKQIVLTNVIAGKAATATAGPTTFAFKDVNGASNGTIAATEATNLDMGQIVHVVSTVRTDDSEPILPLFDALNAGTIAVTNATRGETIVVASLKESGVKARALKTDLQSVGATMTPAKPTDPKSMALADDILHSFEIGAFEASGVSAPLDDPSGPGKLAIARLYLDGLKGGGVAKTGGEAIAYTGPNGTFKIASLDLGDLKVAPPALGPGSPAMVPQIAKAEFGRIDCDLTTKSKEHPDDPPTPVKFTIAHAGFAGQGWAPGTIPRESSVSFQNLDFDVSPDADATKFVSSLGYTHLDLSGDFASSYDEASQDLTVKTLALSGVDMGSVALGLQLSNVGKGLISQNPQIAKAAALGVVAKQIDLKVKNAGLFEKVIAFRARTDDMTVADERDNAIAFFTEELPDMVNDNAAVKALGAAVAKFIAEPKSLHVAVTSKNGLGTADVALIATPDVLLDALDIKASANDE